MRSCSRSRIMHFDRQAAAKKPGGELVFRKRQFTMATSCLTPQSTEFLSCPILKRIGYLILIQIGIALTAATLGYAQANNKGSDLEAGFRQPPESAMPRTWWHWTNGNVT